MFTTPRINPFQKSAAVQFQPGSGMTIKPTGFVDEASKTSFKDVMANVVGDTNRTLGLPDELMNRALTTGDVDVDEVMIANTKADIAVNVASQVITKVIQAYERVQQIQV